MYRALLLAFVLALLAPGSASAAPPANDARASAELITGSLAGRTLAEATVEPGEPLACGSTTLSDTVWFSFLAPSAGTLTTDVLTGARLVSLYRGPSTTPARCGPGKLTLDVTAGETVFLQVGRTPGATAFNFDLAFSFVGTGPPVNDDVGAALALDPVPDQTQSLSLLGAGTQAGEDLTCRANRMDSTVWYSFTAPADGTFVARLRTAQRVLAVRIGTRRLCATGRVTVTASRGERLLIQVGRRGSATSYGTNVQFTFNAPVAANDARDAATLLTGAQAVTVGSSANATMEPGEAAQCPGAALNRSVWYRFVAPVRGQVTFNVTTAKRRLAIYRGSTRTCTAHLKTVPQLSAGEELLIQVSRVASSAGFTHTLKHLFEPSADQDGDGFSPARGDCNDKDPAIHPDALDRESDGIDQNCDGADTRERRQIDVNIGLITKTRSQGRVLAPEDRPVLAVSRVFTGKLATKATVTLRCKGSGCKRAVQKRTVRAGRSTSFPRPLKRGKAGQDSFRKVTIEMSVEYAGAVGQVARWTVTRGSARWKRTNLCVYPGRKVTRCK